MEKRPRWTTPQQLDHSWHTQVEKILPTQTTQSSTKRNPIQRIADTIQQTPIGRLQEKMAPWPGKGAFWIAERVNGRLQERLDTIQQSPQQFSRELEQTVYTELRRTASAVENTIPTRIGKAIPWILAAAGFVPVIGTGVTFATNIGNSIKAAAVEHNIRKASIYLAFAPLNPAIGLLSIIPGIGWIFFPPAILTNSIFVEEMNKKYGIALTEGQLRILSTESDESTQLAVHHAVERFEAKQEKKHARRQKGVPAIQATDVLLLHLQQRERVEKELAEKENPTRRDRRRLTRILRHSHNTERLLKLIQTTKQQEDVYLPRP